MLLEGFEDTAQTGLWVGRRTDLSALLSLGIDPLQLVCPCAVYMGVGRRHRSMQVYTSETHFGVNESMQLEQALPGTLQGAAADQKD